MEPNTAFLLSEASILFAHLRGAKGESAGTEAPVTLPVVDRDLFKQTLGNKIGIGSTNTATIYEVKNCHPRRVYKRIPLAAFTNGDEVRISKIASDCGVAPPFYSAFLLQKEAEKFVVIEMDDVEVTLGDFMEAMADDSNATEQLALSERERTLRDELKIDTVVGKEIIRNKRLPFHKAIQELYAKPEEFYYDLFNKFRILATHSVYYPDMNAGNIVPNRLNAKGIQLIDFGSAKLLEGCPELAAAKIIQSNYIRELFATFQSLPSLSPKSRETIDWFKAQ